jgi:hypothetical protein
MKYLLAITLICTLFVAGCREESREAENHDTTSLHEAILESGISNIIKTVENEDFAFSFAYSENDSKNEITILHFSKYDGNWHYQGSSSSGSNGLPITYTASTWVKGKYSLQRENSYVTVHAGEVVDTNVDKVIVEMNGKTDEATILQNKGVTLWYFAVDNSNGNDRVNKITAYSKNGDLLYQHPSK